MCLFKCITGLVSENPLAVNVLRCAITFMKYFSSVVSLTFLPKYLNWNKMRFPESNSLKLAGLVANELRKTFSKSFNNIHLFIWFIAALCKHFKNSKLEMYLTLQNPSRYMLLVIISYQSVNFAEEGNWNENL